MAPLSQGGGNPADLTQDLDALEAIKEDHASGGVQDPDTAVEGNKETSESSATSAQQQQADEVPAWQKMMGGIFGVTGDEDDDDDDRPHKTRTGGGDISPLGTYEDYVADHWIPGETSMEVSIFRGEPETMRGTNDARWDFCFNISGEAPDSDDLVERLRTEYGGGLFRLRFTEEKPGRQPFTATKKSMVISVEEDPIFKARLGKHLSRIEEKRMETQREIQKEKIEASFQERMITMLEQQRREAAEEARRLREQGQQSPMQEMMFKLLSEQLKDAREAQRRYQEEMKMNESSWQTLMREREREQGEVTQRIVENTMSSQERIFDAMTKKDDGMQPFMMMFMQMQKDATEREAERRREEADRRREERERDRQQQAQQQQMMMMMMQQSQESSKQMMQMMLAMSDGGGKKDDTISKIATVLASSPVVAKLLDRGDDKSDMMKILLPLMTNDKQNAERRAQVLEDRVMQILQQKNDPKQSMMELVQMMQVMQGLQNMMAPKLPEQEDDKDGEEDPNAANGGIPPWLGAASEIADKFGLGRVAEAAATALLSRSGGAAAPPAPVEQPRPPRAAPLAPVAPPPIMPPAALPQGAPPPQQLPPPPMVPTPQAQPAPPQPQVNSQPQASPQQTGQKKMSPQDEQKLFSEPPPAEAKDLFNEIEKGIAGGMSAGDFAKSRSLAEKVVLRALLPKHLAVKYVQHHAPEKENIQSLEGLQWLNELVEHIYR